VDTVCHRCGTAINSSELFCPHCGSPQLRYEPADDGGAAYSSSPQSSGGLNPERVIWKEAITAAVMVAIPVGVLSSLLDFGSLWVIGGGIATVSIYRRRTGIPPAHRMGWRIGSLLGVLAAFVSTAFDSLTLIFERFLLHNGGMIDQRFHIVAQQLTDQLNHSNPEAATVIPGFVHFWLSPDGPAAIALMGAAGSAFSMLLFSAAGGAIGARIASLGNRAPRSS
jgi:hypothetical protein